MRRVVAVLMVGAVCAGCTASDGVISEPEPETAPVIQEQPAEPVSTSTEVEASTEDATPEETGPAVTPAPIPPRPVAFGGVVNVFASDGANVGAPWVPIGAWNGAEWINVGFDNEGNVINLPTASLDAAAATSVHLGATVEGLELGELQEYCVGPEVGPVIDLPEPVEVLNGYGVVAATANWPLQPQPVTPIENDEELVAAGASQFGDVANAAEVGSVVQAFEVDLDGDGSAEQIFTFEYITSDRGTAGDFSGVFVRWSNGDGTFTDERLASYVAGDPENFPTYGRYTIAAVADLNGDGVMEIVVSDTFWESAVSTIFADDNGEMIAVASGGCGV